MHQHWCRAFYKRCPIVVKGIKVSPPTPGSNWTNWSYMWGREAHLWRALEKLNLEYPRDSDD